LTSLDHSCPGFHRDKLQQESIFIISGFPFAPAYRRQAGMTQSNKRGGDLKLLIAPFITVENKFYKIPPLLPFLKGGVKFPLY
jgi:hypothetical protein